MSTPFAETLPARMAMSACAGMGAACFCHPFDVLRVQLQTSGEAGGGVVSTIKGVYARDGPLGFYNGLSAAFLRQWMYGSGRMGIYSYLFNDYKVKNPGCDPSILEKMGFGAISGGIGSFIGTPSEVAIVRMAADGQLPVEQRRNYKHIFDCLTTIAKNEGLGSNGLYKGASVTVARAVVLTSTQMSTYSETKVRLGKSYPSMFPSDTCPQMIFACSGAASFVATFCSNPLDVLKSRIQNMPSLSAADIQAGKKPLYSGLVDCAGKSVRAQGPLVLWSGFLPAFIKLLPYNVISLSILEKLTFIFTGKAAL